MNIGDIVIGQELIHHDLDARPFFSQFEIPLIGITSIPTDPQLTHHTYQASEHFLKQDLTLLNPEMIDHFRIIAPKIHKGKIASGDKFFASQQELDELLIKVPDALCVEMEGASVAQVCYECHIPFSIIRTISDNGNEQSPDDFHKFISSIASHYSLGIISSFLKDNLPK